MKSSTTPRCSPASLNGGLAPFCCFPCSSLLSGDHTTSQDVIFLPEIIRSLIKGTRLWPAHLCSIWRKYPRCMHLFDQTKLSYDLDTFSSLIAREFIYQAHHTKPQDASLDRSFSRRYPSRPFASLRTKPRSCLRRLGKGQRTACPSLQDAVGRRYIEARFFDEDR